MSVYVTVNLTDREADALVRAAGENRGGWHAKPSRALQMGDAKIAAAIDSARATEGNRTPHLGDIRTGQRDDHTPAWRTR